MIFIFFYCVSRLHFSRIYIFNLVMQTSKSYLNLLPPHHSFSILNGILSRCVNWLCEQFSSNSSCGRLSSVVILFVPQSKILSVDGRLSRLVKFVLTEIYNSSKSIIKLVEDTFYPVENLNETNNVDVNINIQEHSIIQNAHIQLDDIKKKHLQKMNTINENHLTDYNQKIVSIQEDIKILQLEFNKYKEIW